MDLPEYDPRRIKVRRGESLDDVQAFADRPSWQTLRRLISNAIDGIGHNNPDVEGAVTSEMEAQRRIRETELRRIREWRANGGPAPRLDPYGHRTAWAHMPRDD